MIIDIHSHLGNILYPDGGNLIYEKGVRKKFIFDLISLTEWGLYRGVPGIDDEWFYKKTYDLIVKASRVRNATATLENMRKSMDKAGVDKTVCMPIPPYVTFNDLRKAREIDSGIIPFTGVDYTIENDFESALSNDVKNGAKGMKLHPIIQKVPLNSKMTFRAVEAFSVYKLPVLYHCGISSYYFGRERAANEIASYGEIRYAKELVSAFPGVSFIAGHTGIVKYKDVIELLGKFDNVWVDISFQAPKHIEELIATFGPEKVLYASDWPYGSRTTTIKTVKKACKGDRSVEKLIFYENAAELLGLSIGK